MRALHFRLAACVAALLVVALVGAAAADDSTGKFKAALADNATFIVIENGKEQAYRLGKDAVILIDGRIAALSDLKEGNTVTVTWQAVNERRVASMIACMRP